MKSYDERKQVYIRAHFDLILIYCFDHSLETCQTELCYFKIQLFDVVIKL